MGAKLIRDKMLEIPWADESTKDMTRATHSWDEHMCLLIAKLLEEVGELVAIFGPSEITQRASKASALEETVDVIEACLGLLVVRFGLSRAKALQVLQRRLADKYDQRGGFEQGMVWEPRHLHQFPTDYEEGK